MSAIEKLVIDLQITHQELSNDVPQALALKLSNFHPQSLNNWYHRKLKVMTW